MIFDLTALQAISSGFNYYKTRESAFKALFRGVSDSVLSGWFTDFSSAEHFPTFRARNAQGTATAPLVTVIPQSETVVQQMLGSFGGRVEGETQDAYVVQEGVELVMFAKSPDMARVYHVVARASHAIARRPLLRAGYISVEYQGSEALTPEEELASEELGIYIKRISLNAQYQIEIPIPTDSDISVNTFTNVLVLSKDQIDKQNQFGGVSPLER